MPLPKCETCQFWTIEKDRQFGECRRHAPRPITEMVDDTESTTGHIVRPRWASTYFEDGCGEHRSIESNDTIPYGRITDTAQTDTPQA